MHKLEKFQLTYQKKYHIIMTMASQNVRIMKRSVTSLRKGLDILCCFGFDEEVFSAQKISKKLDIPLSTTYRYLETLEEGGFLIKDPDNKNYRLGFMIFQIGSIISLQIKLVNVAVPHMKSLASLSGETVLLTTISGWKTLCIESIETSRLIKLTLAPGSTLPLHAGAPSKMLLAYQTDAFVDYFLREVGLTKLTDNTHTDPILLKKELQTIRQQGFAFSNQEVDLGVCAIATPIFYSKGKIAASIAVAGPAERINNENKLLPLIQMAKNASDRITYDLTHKEIL